MRHPDLGKELTNFFNHFIQGNLGRRNPASTHAGDGRTLEQGNQRKATTPGLRSDVSQRLPAAPSSVPKQRTSLRYSDRRSTQYGQKAALESLSRETLRRRSKQNATQLWLNSTAARHSNARTARWILSHIRHLSQHLARSFYNILSRTTLNLVR